PVRGLLGQHAQYVRPRVGRQRRLANARPPLRFRAGRPARRSEAPRAYASGGDPRRAQGPTTHRGDALEPWRRPPLAARAAASLDSMRSMSGRVSAASADSRTLDPRFASERGDRRGGARLRERMRVEATRAGRKGRQLNGAMHPNRGGGPLTLLAPRPPWTACAV